VGYRAECLAEPGGGLKNLPKEYLRPGRQVADLHEALKQAQNGAERWNSSCVSPTPPQVPAGIAEAQQTYLRLVADLASLQNT
jgi:hypothetical protein